MSECTHNCSTCKENCSSRKKDRSEMWEKPHVLSHVGKVIAVVSGKGGVGKSSVTSMLSVLANRKGFKTAVLDADITGPSIPKMFGLHTRATGDGDGIFPVETATGIKTMSLNLLVDSETTPVIWRGPVIAGSVKQFWTDVIWGDVDYMFIDMPPGTGDVPLTVFQSIPVDGIVIVTSPQDLVSMIVAKAVKMAQMMDVPIIGLVENYSYLSCPDCGKKIEVFGKSKVEEVAAEQGLKVLAKLPIDPEFAELCDLGRIEMFYQDGLDEAIDVITAQ